MTVPPDLLPRDGKGSKQWNQIPVVSSTRRATQHTTSSGVGHPLGLTVCGMLAQVVGDDLVAFAVEVVDALGDPPEGVPETQALPWRAGSRAGAAVPPRLLAVHSEASHPKGAAKLTAAPGRRDPSTRFARSGQGPGRRGGAFKRGTRRRPDQSRRAGTTPGQDAVAGRGKSRVGGRKCLSPEFIS